mgnify:CR=1 FL=1
MAVVAAGAILWRKEKNTLKVLLIHRGRYDDWSWPKGKLDKGEGVSEAAVREIKEETDEDTDNSCEDSENKKLKKCCEDDDDSTHGGSSAFNVVR